MFEVHAFPERTSTESRREPAGSPSTPATRSGRCRSCTRSEERFRQFAENLKRVSGWRPRTSARRCTRTRPTRRSSATRTRRPSAPIFEQWKRDVHPDDREAHGAGSPSRLAAREARRQHRIVQPGWLGALGARPRLRHPGRDQRVTHVAVSWSDVTEAWRLAGGVIRDTWRTPSVQRARATGMDLATGEPRSGDDPRPAARQPADPLQRPSPPSTPRTRRSSSQLDASRSRGERLTRPAELQASRRLRARRADPRGGNVGASGRPVRNDWDAVGSTESEEAEKAVAILSGAVEQTADPVHHRPASPEYVNPAFEPTPATGVPEVVGETARILGVGSAPPETFAELWATILSGRTYRGVLANRKKNGEIFYEADAITPIRDSQGRSRNFVSVGRDITARRGGRGAVAPVGSPQVGGGVEGHLDAVESPIVPRRPHRPVSGASPTSAARDLWARQGVRADPGRSASAQPEEPWGTMVADRGGRPDQTSVSLPAESRDQTRPGGSRRARPFVRRRARRDRAQRLRTSRPSCTSAIRT